MYQQVLDPVGNSLAWALDGKEGDIFRRVILWSLGFLVLLCVISGLQASPVLSWMVP